eukprot:CAMPEP_0115034604 /NCGR_PEP_ID=MMETSP0216-20121206/40768_1 /TAXON_ID=223996 /ORGANISM="Protocruzia adherens, Strain Boccale" /LENGTH=468 /DNA_ID=CAMNT_0002413557 /DNA_START=29 /DNA_END=1435 /DNA_ORIENTATION=-
MTDETNPHSLRYEDLTCHDSKKTNFTLGSVRLSLRGFNIPFKEHCFIYITYGVQAFKTGFLHLKSGHENKVEGEECSFFMEPDSHAVEVKLYKVGSKHSATLINMVMIPLGEFFFDDQEFGQKSYSIGFKMEVTFSSRLNFFTPAKKEVFKAIFSSPRDTFRNYAAQFHTKEGQKKCQKFKESLKKCPFANKEYDPRKGCPYAERDLSAQIDSIKDLRRCSAQLQAIPDSLSGELFETLVCLKCSDVVEGNYSSCPLKKKSCGGCPNEACDREEATDEKMTEDCEKKLKTIQCALTEIINGRFCVIKKRLCEVSQRVPAFEKPARRLLKQYVSKLERMSELTGCLFFNTCGLAMNVPCIRNKDRANLSVCDKLKEGSKMMEKGSNPKFKGCDLETKQKVRGLILEIRDLDFFLQKMRETGEKIIQCHQVDEGILDKVPSVLRETSKSESVDEGECFAEETDERGDILS